MPPTNLSTSLRQVARGVEYLIGWAPVDLPVVKARTSTVNLYMVDLNGH